MNKLKLFRKSFVIVLALLAATYALDAKVIIEGPDGTLHEFDDIADCDEWGDLPDDWTCHG